MERRLAAILAADMVGYTRLMGEDEAGTLRRLTNLRERVLQPLIAEHHGRIVKLMGDGLLVEFASAVDSVACAVEWQENVVRDQADGDKGTVLQFRIGINLGDVIVEGEDIHGDGVNIAARLESLAQPGGICVSADIYRHAKGKIKAEFRISANTNSRTWPNRSESTNSVLVQRKRVCKPPPLKPRSALTLPCQIAPPSQCFLLLS